MTYKLLFFIYQAYSIIFTIFKGRTWNRLVSINDMSLNIIRIWYHMCMGCCHRLIILHYNISGILSSKIILPWILSVAYKWMGTRYEIIESSHDKQIHVRDPGPWIAIPLCSSHWSCNVMKFKDKLQDTDLIWFKLPWSSIYIAYIKYGSACMEQCQTNFWPIIV